MQIVNYGSLSPALIYNDRYIVIAPVAFVTLVTPVTVRNEVKVHLAEGDSKSEVSATEELHGIVAIAGHRKCEVLLYFI